MAPSLAPRGTTSVVGSTPSSGVPPVAGGLPRSLGGAADAPPEGELRIVTLGGLGAIGMNCMVLEQGQDLLVIDCGVTFPSDDLGVDVLHPRFDHLFDRESRVRGVFLTHGHEDHIGALPYLLDRLDVPVWGPAHALALVRRRLAEHGFDVDRLPLHEVRVGDRVQVGSFEVEPIRVTHSIADATALAIRTVAGVVLHTGDFKLDARPCDGELTDEARLRALGDEGIRLLLSDSTNVDSPGWSTSESVVGESLERTILAAEQRVVVGLFASNVQRLTSLGAIARRAGRKICLLGRSMQNHVDVARELGRLDWPSDLVISPLDAQGLPRRELLGLATGTQAETKAALARLALGTHPRLRLDPGDQVILSSRVIPGNDRVVVAMMSDFLRAGIEVVSRWSQPGIHASGHAHRDEQRTMLELTRPRSFVPVHGTLHHLTRHAELARGLGVADVRVIEDGQIIGLRREGEVELRGKTTSGRVAVAGGEAIDPSVLRERTNLARQGVLAVAVVLDEAGRGVGRARVTGSGVCGPLDGDVLELASRAVDRALGALDDRTRRREESLLEAVRLAARRAVEAEIGVRPTVLVQVVRG